MRWFRLDNVSPFVIATIGVAFWRVLSSRRKRNAPETQFSRFGVALTPGERSEIVREAYRKHGLALSGIEAAQNKLVIGLLAILSAGASLFASRGHPFTPTLGMRLGLTVVVVALVTFAALFTRRRNAARQAVRELLIRCEEALALYDYDVYITNAPLYPVKYRQYATSGSWLGGSLAIVILASVGFLIILWAA